ncbi:MAG: flagella basal body P-ring formation protein FlgA [Armatimonadetes bacterium]|nr:flagella basal body P-ring formation protein FlgA [Armatimonadota bacterium]
MHRTGAILFLLASSLAAGVAVAPTAHAASVTVSLRPAVRVATETVTLAQIAVLEGPETVTRLLSQVVILQAPAPGASAQTTAAKVAEALAASGFDVKGITIRGATYITVYRDGTPAPATRNTAAAPAGSTNPGNVVVTRGSTVQVVAAIGAIQVSTQGVALAQGALGETIPVRILATRREVAAVVVTHGLVAVQF